MRVLLAVCRPIGTAPIDPKAVQGPLEHGLRSLAETADVIVDVLSPPTHTALIEAVTTGNYHIVHFDGHGILAQECPKCHALNAPERDTCGGCGVSLEDIQAQGYLLFEDEYGSGHPITASQMQSALRNTPVRLVVMNACQSAMIPLGDIWRGAAPALVQAGVPLVVAMQVSVPVKTVVAFCSQFYASLAYGKPLIEAVADGRRPLVGRRYNDTWFIPVLYARTVGDYHLFRPRPPEEAEVAPERADLRQALRRRRAELDRLEEATARQGAVFDPAQMAVLRGKRDEVAELRHELAKVKAKGVARATSVLYGVPSNPYFVGRADEMRDTVKALEKRQVVVVWGTPGIGKSALAIEMAHRHSWRWPGGVLWLSCQGGPPFETLLNQMGAFCGQDLSQADPARKPELVRGLLAGLEDCLLIWDNYEDVEGDEDVRRSLLRYDGVRHGYHALVRQYAYARLCEREDPRTVHRLAAEYLNSKLKERGGTPQEGLEACDQWEQAEAWEEFAKNSSALVGSLDRMGYWGEIRERLERAREAVKTHLDDAPPDLEAGLLNSMGIITAKSAGWDEAIALWEEAADLCRATEDEKGLAQTYNNLGLVYADKGEWERAIEFYEKSLETKERVGDIQGVAYTSGNLGLIHLQRGELDEAEKLFRYNLEISQSLGDVHSTGLAFNALGQVFDQRGDTDRAAKYYARAFLIFAQLGAAPQAQQAGGLLAQLLGSAEKAQEYVEEFLRRQE